MGTRLTGMRAEGGVPIGIGWGYAGCVHTDEQLTFFWLGLRSLSGDEQRLRVRAFALHDFHCGNLSPVGIPIHRLDPGLAGMESN